MTKTGYREKEIIARFEAMRGAYLEGGTRLGDPPEALFDTRGNFSDSNWNSGQDLRALLEERGMFDARMDGPFEVWTKLESGSDDELDTDCGVFWSGEKRCGDQSYAMINVVLDGADRACDSYLISWYKSRGRVETFFRNNEPITLSGYCALLEILDKAGFFEP